MKACLFAALMAPLLTLAACAGPNGAASGTHRGASARADIFKIPFP